MFDRDKAREVLRDGYWIPDGDVPIGDVLDALAACVVETPHTIDRDSLNDVLTSYFRGHTGPQIRTAVGAVLALVRPVEGIILTSEEAEWVRDLLVEESGRYGGQPDYNTEGADDLIKRLDGQS